MIETVAFTIICFILCNDCTTCVRLKKAGGGAILFIVSIFSYNTLQPLLPTQIDHLLHSTIWGFLFAYAVPNPSKKENKKDEDCKEEDCVEKKSEKDETPPISDLN
jgi:hypothetical protein